eukprot:m.235684 g.235684  ORF g.235684 m.235684 type:complete len:150 (+) comp19345_c2_seq4:82-531(+)
MHAMRVAVLAINTQSRAVMGMNILIVGNLSALNEYVITTWSNAEVLAINQDPEGHSAVDLSSVVTTAPAVRNDVAGVVHNSFAQVQECGGEPDLQTWTYNTPDAGYLKNTKTNACLNVAQCKTAIIYDAYVSIGLAEHPTKSTLTVPRA